MARIHLEEILGGLQEAAVVVKSIAERQHIDNLSKYFDENGTPHVQKFMVNGKEMNVPLFVFADHSSIGLDTLEIEFEARIIPQSKETSEPSNLKKSLLGMFRKKKPDYEIGNLSIDAEGPKKGDKSGMGKIKIIFKKDDKPEAVSRMVDKYISLMGHDES